MKYLQKRQKNKRQKNKTLTHFMRGNDTYCHMRNNKHVSFKGWSILDSRPSGKLCTVCLNEFDKEQRIAIIMSGMKARHDRNENAKAAQKRVLGRIPQHKKDAWIEEQEQRKLAMAARKNQ